MNTSKYITTQIQHRYIGVTDLHSTNAQHTQLQNDPIKIKIHPGSYNETLTGNHMRSNKWRQHE